MKRTIRDFLFLDSPRLYSFCAQLVGSAKMAEFVPHLGQGDGPPEPYVDDELFCRLFGQLSQSIPDVSMAGVNELLPLVRESGLVRVGGVAEIEDYGRIVQFFADFNRLGEAVAHAHTQAERLRGESVDAGSVESRIREKMAKLEPAQVAQTLGLRQDPQTLSDLSFLTELFYPKGFEVVVHPESATGISYRSVVSADRLRLSPSHIRALFGGFSQQEWVVVGQITYIPAVQTERVTLRSQDTHKKEGAEADEGVLMRDPMRAMFRTGRLFDRMFAKSGESVEAMIQPLAIFRETHVDVTL